MAISDLGKFFRTTTPTKKDGDVSISYSQFAMWSACPHRWKLNYIDKNRIYKPSIHATFGSSFHETLQYYLHVMYKESVKEADKIDLAEVLREQMINNYASAMIDNDNKHFSTRQELGEFLQDGIEILNWLKRHRTAYFSNKDYELVGIEMPLYSQATEKSPKVIINGFLDIVLRDKKSDRFLIIDIKTSTRGWNESAKKDKTKASQLVLYKSYFAKQYGYDEDKIDIEYLIVKRKLIEGFAYPQKRVQIFTPASGKPTRNKLLKEIEEFISSGFNEDGTYKVDGNFPAIATGNNCKYCEFCNSDLCPKENRIR